MFVLCIKQFRHSHIRTVTGTEGVNLAEKNH